MMMRISLMVLGVAFLITPTMAQQSTEIEPVDQVRRASDLLDADITGSDGETLASVDDVIMEPEGKIYYVIASRGGVLGIGADSVAIPFKALECDFSRDEASVRLNMTQQGFENAPKLGEEGVMQLANRDWHDENHDFYGVENDGGHRPDQIIRASQVNGTAVRPGERGDELAEVSDFVFDNEGQVKFFILSSGGFLGIGSDQIAVPASKLTIRQVRQDDRTRVAVRTDLSQSKLENAPRIKDDRLEDTLTSPQYVSMLSKHYSDDNQ